MAAANTPRKLVVCGGTGFLGSRIIKFAAQRPSWNITSLSRTGTPDWSSITSSPDPPEWAANIHWEKADLLRPGSYDRHLEGADAVVHSMGILLEADYKGVLTGKESPLSGLRRAFSSSKQGSASNPLEKGAEDGLKSGESDGQVTYELMNRDSAIALARSAHAHGAKSFVYISAAGGAPILPTRYISTKRQAEQTIANEFPSMRPIFPRPGFLYDPSRRFTVAMAYPTMPIAALNNALGKFMTPLAGAAVEMPSKVDDVARAIVEALEDESVAGPLSTEVMGELATRAWRKGML